MKKRTVPIILALIFILFLYVFANAFLLLDFSQDYRKIPNIEKVIFQRHRLSNIYYKRCFWGLCKSEPPVEFKPYHSDIPVLGIETLKDIIGEHNEIGQAVISPDSNYILYCELEYDYYNSGMTDDEYCYYRVYDVNTKEIITIYQGYKEWYNIGWLE